MSFGTLANLAYQRHTDSAADGFDGICVLRTRIERVERTGISYPKLIADFEDEADEMSFSEAIPYRSAWKERLIRYGGP